MSDPSTWSAEAHVLLDVESAPVRARALVLDEPLSFWGGVDPGSGVIIDGHHPQAGHNVAGRALVMPAGRGSSSSSSVLAEAIRAGHGPWLIVLAETDDIVVLGALVAQLLGAPAVPVVVLEPGDYSRIASGDDVALSAGGAVSVAAQGGR
jgi:uncharacterized protein